MPTTIATAFVIVIAIVPGAVGSFLYNAVIGLDWREKDWDAAIRYVAFSMLGLCVYILVADRLNWWPAIHIIPATYAESTFVPSVMPRVVWPYLGHLCGSAAVGLAAALAKRAMGRISGATPYPGAWDAFVRDSLPDRWVAVSLKSGDVFAGYVKIADVGVTSADRDIVLSEPALYNADTKNYTTTSYHQLFLPADLIQNVATIANEADQRLGAVAGTELFTKESLHEQKNSPVVTSAASAASPRDS
jgi:hypothetical protein